MGVGGYVTRGMARCRGTMAFVVWEGAGELWRSWRGKVQGNYGIRGVVRCRGTMAFVAW